MTARRAPGGLAVSFMVALVATGCTADAGGDSAKATVTTASTLTVGAASSLTDVFEAIAEEFTAVTGVSVRTTFAGSSTLAEQLRNGAPIDVIASAGSSVIAPLVAEQVVGEARGFATNSLMIAVPSGNPAGVTGLTDLTRVSVVVCAEPVPCGTATSQLFARAELGVNPVSYEPDARSVLMKIRLDEADAGLVYVTDVAAADSEVDAVEIPADTNVVTTYQAAVVTEAAHQETAARFVRFLSEPQAQALLAEAGFGPPS